tara:strand:- start:844 stop:1002 length:159 start_codon:yes stop_codon:yes gene_type:complete
MANKKETKPKKEAFKMSRERYDELWDVIDEIQENLDFINTRLLRVMDRMGLE